MRWCVCVTALGSGQFIGEPGGYLYRVGRDRGRKVSRDVLVADLDGVVETLPWVEPGLGAALMGLQDQQRIVVTLIHGYEWSLTRPAHFDDNRQ